MTPHFNDFSERYEHSNTFLNPNSTEVGLIAYANHLKSFTDNDFVNSVTGLSTTESLSDKTVERSISALLPVKKRNNLKINLDSNLIRFYFD